MLFGSAYYPEYRPHGRLRRDVELMQEASFTCVRVGESTWSSWEPEDGRFDVEWMAPVLDALHEAGIRAILGTPTYAIPPWLARKHPEIMGRRVGGVLRPYRGRTDATDIAYGGRQNMNLASPAYRFHCERVIRRVIGRYADHPAVTGYQIDNEPGVELLDNDDVFHGFVDWVRHTYGDLESVNEVWGLEFWSQRLSSWADLWRPAGNTNPGYDLAWRRYQAHVVSDFIAWQADIVRGYAHHDQFLTTCLVGAHGRSTADRIAINAALDVPTDNVYVATQEGLRLPPPEDPSRWGPFFMSDGGVWSLHQHADMARSTNGRDFLVTETNGRAIGDSATNLPAYDGQLRLIAHTLAARGARLVAYWHWQTNESGHEQYWSGVLGHDLEPGRAYEEVAHIGRELAAHGDLLDSMQADADIALLYSQDSKYAFEASPPLMAVDGSGADPASYQRIFDTCYQAFFSAGAQLGVVHPGQHLDGYAAVVVPALYVAREELLEELVTYAAGGGHLVVTFRSGYVDEHARARRMRGPGPLREAAGVSYQEYANLPYPLPLRVDAGADLTLPRSARATAWADGLELEGAQALAWYHHPHHGRFPAVTTHAWGGGRVTYVGTLPDAEMGQAIATWVLHSCGIDMPWARVPDSVRVSTGSTADGSTVHLLANWSDTVAHVHSVVAGLDVLGGHEIVSGELMDIDPWGLRLLLSSDG